jgi:hypothetical protein
LKSVLGPTKRLFRPFSAPSAADSVQQSLPRNDGWPRPVEKLTLARRFASPLKACEICGLVGLGLGAVGAWWLSRYFTALLFGIKPFDALTYFAVAALLLATALGACYLPGRRAMRIDPAVALRIE